nr:MAG TPA: hypothetical protein [Bacteriophage sp.]
MSGRENNEDYYRRRIIELVKNCESEKWLRAIFVFVKRLLE